MRDGRPTCNDCEAFIAVQSEVNTGLCMACQQKQKHAECQCGDCQRKRGAENFEDPQAFERQERARRLLATVPRCVECGAQMLREARLLSLACPECVRTLGDDGSTGRWDGVPEQDEKKERGAA